MSDKSILRSLLIHGQEEGWLSAIEVAEDAHLVLEALGEIAGPGELLHILPLLQMLDLCKGSLVRMYENSAMEVDFGEDKQ